MEKEGILSTSVAIVTQSFVILKKNKTVYSFHMSSMHQFPIYTNALDL